MGIVVNMFAVVLCRMCHYYFITIPILALIILKLYNKISMGFFKKSTRMDGKTVIITGANSGLGEMAALDLASRGARIIMACRDLGKANGVRDDIVGKTQNKNIFVKKLDLSSLDSVREFAEQILQEEKHIHILMNNAGQGGLMNKITKDGLQLGMQVNHFGPFLLTNLLIGRLRDSAPSRIVNVSSVAHRLHKLDIDDLNCTKKFHHWTTYCNAKLCNILMTTYLSKLLDGTGVTANSVHPGVVSTNAFDKLKLISPFTYTLTINFIKYFCKNSWQGVQTQLYAAIDPDLENVSGKYFQDCRESRCQAPESKDMKLAEQVWNKSLELVKLTKSDLLY